MSSYYKEQLNDWVASLEVKADTVFDIGGSQHPIKGRTKSWEVGGYKIFDLAEPHVVKQKPDVILDMNQYLFDETQDQADLIFCLEVFDYVIDPMAAFKNLNTLLKTSGSAWVSFPFVYPIHNPADKDGLRYTEPAIRQLATAAQLKVEEIIYRRPRPGNRHLLDFYATDGMRAAQGMDHNVTGYIVRLAK